MKYQGDYNGLCTSYFIRQRHRKYGYANMYMPKYTYTSISYKRSHQSYYENLQALCYALNQKIILII